MADTTKGPWRVVPAGEQTLVIMPASRRGRPRRGEGNGRTVATVIVKTPEDRANAQAIAALPDLLEACAAARDWLRQTADFGLANEGDAGLLGRLNAALAKALAAQEG